MHPLYTFKTAPNQPPSPLGFGRVPVIRIIRDPKPISIRTGSPSPFKFYMGPRSSIKSPKPFRIWMGPLALQSERQIRRPESKFIVAKDFTSISTGRLTFIEIQRFQGLKCDIFGQMSHLLTQCDKRFRCFSVLYRSKLMRYGFSWESMGTGHTR